MFVETNYYFLIRSFLPTLTVLSFLVFPAITLAYPNYEGSCSNCHGSTDTGLVEEDPAAEDTTIPITEVDLSTSDYEDPAEEDTAIPTTEIDLIEPVSTEEDTLTLPTEIESTSEENPTELTTVPTNNVDQFTTQLDLNGDGQITQDEVQALRSEFFDSVDTNADGFLTNEELQAAKGTPAIPLLGNKKFGCEANFNRLDNNQDGLISKAEFVNNVPLFDKFDLDGDGIISAEELTLSRPHQPWMAHKNRYSKWINDRSYKEAGHKKNGNFGRH